MEGVKIASIIYFVSCFVLICYTVVKTNEIDNLVKQNRKEWNELMKSQAIKFKIKGK